MANLDADERKIALRHTSDVLTQLTIAAGAGRARIEDAHAPGARRGAEPKPRTPIEASGSHRGRRQMMFSRAELAAYLILASLFGFCMVAAVMSAGGML